MIIGVSGLAVALVVGGWRSSPPCGWRSNRTLDTEARATAEQVAAMVAENRLPAPIPVSGAQLIQVVDGEGRVIGGSLLADRLTPLLRPDELSRALAGSAVEVSGARAGLDGPLRVVAAPGGRPGVERDRRQSGRGRLASQRTLRNALLILFPLLLGLLGVIAYVVIGWTLRPVEQLRRGAERISGGGADERLPVPQAADEIRALAVTLNTMLDRLAAGRERQRSFVADAAHELRSPLTSMRTQLEVAQHLGEGGVPTEDMLADVKRLSVLVEDLLLLARADADQRPPAVPETVELRSLLADVASSMTKPRVPVRVVAGGPVLARRTGRNCGGRWPTWSTTASGTPGRRSNWTLPRPIVLSASESAMTGPASTRSTGNGCSTGSPDWMTLAGGTPVDPVWGWPSCGNWCDRSGGTVRFVDGEGRWSLRAEIVLPLPTPPPLS